MLVLFVQSELSFSAGFSGIFHQGVGILSAVLKEQGHETALLHLLRPPDGEEEICDRVSKITRNKRFICAITTTALSWPQNREIAHYIKRNFDTTIIAGGPHVTLNPKKVFSWKALDAICVGDGENSISKLVALQDGGKIREDIPGLWHRFNGREIISSTVGYTKDLDALPFADRELYDYRNLEDGKTGCAYVMVSRGCPMKCTYCSNISLKQLLPGSYVRFKSVDRAIEELKYILANYEYINEFAFDDDILPMRRDWFCEFAKKYKTEVNRPFTCNIFPTMADRETLEILADMGCKALNIGLESGSPEIRNKILKRKYTNEQMIEVGGIARELGIKLATFNIFGIPTETFSQMLETVKLNAQVRAYRCNASIQYPIPGTGIYNICAELNLIPENLENIFINSWQTQSVLKFPVKHKERIAFLQKYMRLLVLIYKKIYKLPPKLSTITAKMMDILLSLITCNGFMTSAINSVEKMVRKSPLVMRFIRPIARNLLNR